MTIARTHVHLNRHIRMLRKKEKHYRNAIIAYRAEVEYHQAIIDGGGNK